MNPACVYFRIPEKGITFMKKFFSILTALVLLCSMALCVPAQAAEKNPVTEAMNGVVRIFVINYSWGEAVDEETGETTLVRVPSYATGTGFAIGTAGESSAIFATNHHVVTDDDGQIVDEIYIVLDNEWFDAWREGYETGKLDEAMKHMIKCEVIYTPEALPDYAIIRAERVVTERVALPLMSAKEATPGETIYALGFPGAADYVSASGSVGLDEKVATIEDMTVTKGVVSRLTTAKELADTNVVQIDAQIGGGNSGGPLITEEGYVIGLNTFGIETDMSLNYAVQIDYIIERCKHLNETSILPGFEPTVVTREEPEPTELETEPIPTETEPVPTETKPVTPVPNPVNPVVIGVVALLVVAVVVVVVLATKKKPAAQPAAKAEVKQSKADDFPKTMPAADVIGKTMPAYSVSYRLVGEAGFFAGRRFAIDRPLRLGRDPQKNDLVFESGTAGVSGAHCVLTPVADGVEVMDLGSTYGTLLGDGTKLTANKSAVLKDGDTFCLGSQKQLFKIERKEK